MNILLVLLIFFASVCRAYVLAYNRTAWVFSRSLCNPVPGHLERAEIFLPTWVTWFSCLSLAVSLFTASLGFTLHGVAGAFTTLAGLSLCTFLARRVLPPSNTTHYQAPCLQRVADHLYQGMHAGDYERAAKMRSILVKAGIPIHEIPEG